MKSFLSIFLLKFLTTVISSTLDESLNACNGRIIGGYQADISQIPFQVALNLNRGPKCGGSLISGRWVLTAAHCVQRFEVTDKFQVRIDSTYGLAHGRLVDIESSVMHPKYNPLSVDYDFALLELAEEIELSEEFYAVELPEQDEPVEDGKCLQVSGWGKTEHDDYGSEDLRLINVPVVNWEECRVMFRKINYLTERMICAGSEHISACHGDSGGPLVDGRKLVGVVSWAYPSVCVGYPVVFAQVSSVRSWIKFVSDV